MDKETYDVLGTGLQAIGTGIGLWPLCKYVIGPAIGTVFPTQHLIGLAKDQYKAQWVSYEQQYAKIAEQRTQVLIELSKAGKNKTEISDFVDASLPFPTVPKPMFK